MTLKELLSKADVAKWTVRVPSAVMLAESGAKVILCEALDADTTVTIYQSGYAVYQKKNRSTVFPLYACKDFTEIDVTGNENIIPYDTFADQTWQIRIFLEGEKRLEHNEYANDKYRHVLSLEYCGWECDFYSDQGMNDPLNALVQQDVKAEEIEKLKEVLDTLSKKQRYIFHQCAVCGRMQSDVAKELGSTRQNVTNILRRTLAQLRETYGISGRSFPDNHFSNNYK